METHHIPESLLSDNDNSLRTGKISIIPFSALADGNTKNKIILSQNLITFIIDGEKIIYNSEEMLRVNNTQLLLHSAGNCLMSEKTAPNGIYKSILIFFDDNALSGFYTKYPRYSYQQQDTKSESSLTHLLLHRTAFFENYLHSLQLIFGSGKNISDDMKQLKFEELMLHLLENHPKANKVFAAKHKVSLDDLKIKQVIESSIDQNLTIEELAFLCNMSQSTFKRHFSKIYQTSPSKWILQKKMEMAAHLLQYKKERPSDIYYKMGYENLSSFTQAFKQAYGKTPKEFQSEAMTF